jgi:hypothetical protein
MELQLKVHLSPLNKLLNKLNFLFLYLLCLNIIFYVPCQAHNVYTCKDVHGNVLYTDLIDQTTSCITQPIVNNIKPLPNFKSNNSTVINHNNITNNKIEVNNQDDNSIIITSPTNNETVNSCGGILEVKFSTTSVLDENDTVYLFIDGSKWSINTGAFFTVNNLSRGNHSLTVKIFRNQELRSSSETINFNFLRNCAK